MSPATEGRYRMAYLTRVIRHGKPKPPRRTPGPLVHGSAATYNHRGCRCEKCKAGHRERAVEYRRIPRTWPAWAHGRNTTYGCGCRCKSCKRAHADAQASWKATRQGGVKAMSPLDKRKAARQEYLRDRNRQIKAGTWAAR